MSYNFTANTWKALRRLPRSVATRKLERQLLNVSFADGSEVRAYALPGEFGARAPLDLGRPVRAAIQKWRFRQDRHGNGDHLQVPAIVSICDQDNALRYDHEAATLATSELRSARVCDGRFVKGVGWMRSPDAFREALTAPLPSKRKGRRTRIDPQEADAPAPRRHVQRMAELEKRRAARAAKIVPPAPVAEPSAVPSGTIRDAMLRLAHELRASGEARQRVPAPVRSQTRGKAKNAPATVPDAPSASPIVPPVFPETIRVRLRPLIEKIEGAASDPAALRAITFPASSGSRQKLDRYRLALIATLEAA